jgi:hypothetical protein
MSKKAQNWGLSLREMKSLLTGAERSPNFCASIRAAAAKRVAAIDDEMATLAARVRSQGCGVLANRQHGQIPGDETPQFSNCMEKAS